MEIQGKSDKVIEHVGCGRYQFIHVLCVGMVSYASMVFTNHFMAFGNYNPGWRCLDPHNGTIHGDNMTTLMDATRDGKSGLGMTYNNMSVINNNVTSQEYSVGDCSVFESCKNVEFNPEATTIVTEWSLVCDKAWIPSLMISLQMAGFTIGSCVAGVLGDTYGRKFALYMSLVFVLIFNVISVFSTSWQMFATMRLILGILMAFNSILFIIYMAEFVTMRWRAIVVGMPHYPVGVVFFGLTCFLIKDWRYVHVATSVVTAAGIIPAFYLPESLRWLEVKNKAQEFQLAAQKIAKTNHKTQLGLEQLTAAGTDTKTKRINIKDVFRNILQLFGKEHRKYTLIVSIPWFSASILYYAIAFGVKDLDGNFYVNLILFYAIESVIDSFLMFAPNAFGRKKAGVAFCSFSGICLLVASIFQKLVSGSAKIYGVTLPVMMSRISISAFWAVLHVFMVELYPTVARGAASSWGMFTARLGGIMAPVFIPTKPSTVFICYAIMGILAVICALLVTCLPETRGKALKESFGETNIVSKEKEDTAV